MKEPAHVGAPVRDPGEPGVQPERDLRFERREVVVDVARPARRPEPLHSRRAGPAEHEHALVGPVGGLALGEGLLAEAVVDIVQAACRRPREAARAGGPSPPSSHQPADPELPRAPDGPPTTTRGRPGWRSRRSAARRDRPRRRPAPRARSPRQQVAARLGVGEQRRLLVEHRVLVGDHLEVLSPRLVEQGGRVRPELGLELEVPHAAVPAEGLSVAREVDQPVARDSLLADRARQRPQLGGVIEVAGGLDEAERPSRRERWRGRGARRPPP